MKSYYAEAGHVLVVRYPIAPRTASDGPPLPITIGPGPAGQTGANASIAYTVWEPYEAQTQERTP